MANNNKMNPPIANKLHGEVLFNFTDHDGLLMIGVPPFEFMTKWSTAGAMSVHTLSDHPTVKALGIAEGVREIHDVDQAQFDKTNFSSRYRTPQVRQIVLMENADGYKAAIKIIDVHKNNEFPSKNSLQFRFAITQDKGADFSSFDDELFAGGYLLDMVDKTLPSEPDATAEASAMLEAEQSATLGNIPDPFGPADSDSWTGGSPTKQSAAVVLHLAPSAMEATELLLGQFEAAGDNRGPPLDIDKEALDSLKKLHAALGDLIECANSENLDRLPGFIKEANQWAKQFKQDVRDNPIPFTIATAVAGPLAFIDVATTGGMLTGAALTYGMKKRN